jgi:predicted O-methyltransferase YrrM
VSGALDRLLADAPALHGPPGPGEITHGLLEPALRFIDRMITPGSRTLETGSGYSTILFAATGAQHTCIVPNPQEVDRIRAYCAEHQISVERVDFRLEASERLLPSLELEPLDLVLIDGSHSFPQVFIDWFYTAAALKPGGHLLIDDVHVWAGRVLRDFLRAEPEWALVTEYRGRTAVLRKTGEFDPDRLWLDQGYVRRHSRLGAPGIAVQIVSMVRHGQAGELAQIAIDRLRRR